MESIEEYFVRKWTNIQEDKGGTARVWFCNEIGFGVGIVAAGVTFLICKKKGLKSLDCSYGAGIAYLVGEAAGYIIGTLILNHIFGN